MALKLTWYDDNKAESDLRRMAIAFDKVSIPFSRIDLKESQVNGARLRDAIREHKVEDYMQGFRNRDTFPRPIVYRTASGFVILSGNQRCEAIRRLIADGDLHKGVEIEVYLVDTKDPLLLELVARTANVAHGEGETKEDRIQQAAGMVRRGIAVNDAALYFLVSATSIHRSIRAEDQRNRLMKAGIEAAHVSVSALEPLAKLDFDESAQLKIGALIAQHPTPADRVKQVVASVAKQSSAPARLQKIREFEKECSAAVHASNGHDRHKENGASKVPLRPRRDKFFGLLNRLVNFLESENAGEAFTDMDQIQISSESERTRATTLCKKLRYRLGVIAK